MTPSPADLLRLPGEAVGGARRIVAELVLLRRVVESAVLSLETQLADLRAETAQIRRRVDELADSLPTDDSDGPLTKVRKALTEGPA